jgi:hypothetical protein
MSNVGHVLDRATLLQLSLCRNSIFETLKKVPSYGLVLLST